MVSRRRTRTWPRWTLLVCLLLLSLVAPLWWAGQLQPPPRRVRPVEGFSVQPVPYEPSLPLKSFSEDHFVTAPPLLAPVREQAEPEISATAQTQTDVFDSLAARLADSRSQASLADQGRHAAFGSLVAENYYPAAEGEILPPGLPEISTSLTEGNRLERATFHSSRRNLSGESQHRNGDVATLWPKPHALIETLAAIAGDYFSERWANDVLQELAALAAVPSIESDESAARLEQLDRLARDADGFVRRVRPAGQQALVLKARDGLARRASVWQQVRALADRNEPTQFIATVADDKLALQIRRAIRTIPGEKAPPAWQDYLGLDTFQEALADYPLDVYHRAALASFTLNRLHSPRLDERQRGLLDNPEFRQLEKMLREASTQPINPMDVMFAMEQYEQTRTPADGERLAALAARLRWSTDDAVAELGQRIDDEYRAANVRLAITDDYFNRSLPKSETKSEAVDEVILNAYVAGQREVDTQLSVKFIPDAHHWRMTMNADGKMASNTTSYADSAALFTQGAGTFSASKLIVVDRHRVRVWPAKAEAKYQGELYGASTSMEGIPILSRFARNSATQGYYENQWAAAREIEARLKERAAKRLDTQAREQLEEADARLTSRVLLPLQRTGVSAIPLHLATTEDRVVAEYRLAGMTQLGGHTARPWAPENALLSMQIHETAINNIVAGLRLDGRQAHIRDLFPEIYGTFGRDDYTIPDSMPDNVTVLFADENAVRISFQEGRMEVILQLAELRTDRNVWRDLTVRNYYAPDTTSLDAKLVRDSTVRLKGERLGARDQFALRAIFTKIFGDNNEFAVIPEELVDGAGLEGLAITQFVIRDGWLGVAIAPPHAGVTRRITDGGPVEIEARRTDVIFE